MSQLHIVIPIINEHAMTQRAIDTIVTKKSHTIHIIDQDSDLTTQAWYQDKQNDRYYVHRYSPKVSLSEAWNRGVQESLSDAECEYVFIINNDVLFNKQTIDNLCESFTQSQHVMVTCNNVAPLYKEAFFLDMNTEKDDHINDEITDWRQQGPDFSSFMISKETIEKVGWFDENYVPAYYEDNDYHLRIIKAGLTAKRTSSAPFFHYGSITARNNNVSSGFSQNRFIEKWNVSPTQAMDGLGYHSPYNNSQYSYKYWRGVEKYKDIEYKLFGKNISI